MLTSMVAAAGRLALLVTSFPQGAWGRTPVLAEAWGLVPSEPGAQAPIFRAGVSLLTLLRLWDLEHALGCRGKMVGSYGTAGANGGWQEWEAGAPGSLSHLRTLGPPCLPSPPLSSESGWARSSACPPRT